MSDKAIQVGEGFSVERLREIHAQIESHLQCSKYSEMEDYLFIVPQVYEYVMSVLTDDEKALVRDWSEFFEQNENEGG